MKRSHGILGIGLLLAGVILAGCGKETTKPAPVPDPRATKMGLIGQFAKAHEDRDIDAYEECLHPDYQFWLSADNLGDCCWDWAEWMAKTKDVETTERMFNAEDVIEIQVELTNLSTVEGAQSDEDRFHETFGPGEPAVTAYWAEFAIDLHVIEGPSESPIDHHVDGEANIYFVPDPQTEGLWRVWKIEDEGNANRKVDRTTWSALKLTYGGESSRSTKTGLIEMFARAHEDRDIVDYESCLHEDYQFWFAQDDVGSPDWDWTDWIGRMLDIEITERMFAADDVTDITVDFVNRTVAGADTPDDPEDDFFTALINDPSGGPERVTVYWGDFTVNMHVIEDAGDVRTDHWVDGRAYMYFLPDPQCEGQWQIWKIEDKGNNHRKVDATTWTDVKVVFRPPKYPVN